MNNLPSPYVGVIVSLGASAFEVESINYLLSEAGFNVSFLCPQWIIQYKKGNVILHSDPPARPLSIALCSHSYGEVLSGQLRIDTLIVPGGLFSTGGVLRNDGELSGLLHSYYLQSKTKTMSKYMVFTGSGVQTMISGGVGLGQKVAAIPTVTRDLSDAGYNLETIENETLFGNVMTLATIVCFFCFGKTLEIDRKTFSGEFIEVHQN